MAQIIREITADVAQTNNLRAITAKQNDLNSRFLKINITNEGVPLKVDQGSDVIMNVKRSDNSVGMYYGSVNDDGSVTVPLTSWMLGLEGSITCDVSIVRAEDKQKLTTMQFSIYVESAVYPQSVLEDNENYDVLVELLDAADKAVACAEATQCAIDAAERANAAANGVIITEQNKNTPLTFWVGTQAEYDALVEKDMGCFYIISDDSDLEAINASIAAVANAMQNHHTIYDISPAVVSTHGKDVYTLEKYGKMLELRYRLVQWRDVEGGTSLSGQIAKIEGYAPRGTLYVEATPHITVADSWDSDPQYCTVPIKIAPDSTGENTIISINKNVGMYANTTGTSLLSFNIAFLCK